MFLTVATSVHIRNLRGSGHLLPAKQKPTDAGIALGIFCMRAHNAKDADLDLTGLLIVEVMPDTHLHLLTLFVGALPVGIGWAVGGRILAGKTCPIQPGSARLACFGRSGAIQN